MQQPRLLLKNIAIFYIAIFRSGRIKALNITHKTCNVKSYIKIKRETCWGRLALVSSQALMQPFALSPCPHNGRMERPGRIKARKLVGRGKNSLIWRRQGGREGVMQMTSLTTFPSQCISNGHPRSQRSHSFLHLYFYWLLNVLLHGTNYLFDQSGSVVLAMSPPNLCPSPAYWPKGRGTRREGIDAVNDAVNYRWVL